MRWTWRARLTYVAERTVKSCGIGRRGAGAKSAERGLFEGDGGKRAVLREEHEVSRKAIAQGRPECSSCPVCSCAVLFAQIARETAGAASTRLPVPSTTKRASEDAKPRGGMRWRDREGMSACRTERKSETRSTHPAALMGYRFAPPMPTGFPVIASAATSNSIPPLAAPWIASLRSQ